MFEEIFKWGEKLVLQTDSFDKSISKLWAPVIYYLMRSVLYKCLQKNRKLCSLMSDRPLQLVELLSGKLLRKPHQIKLLLPAVIHRKNILLYFPPFFLKVVRFLISAIWSRYQSCIKTESEKNRVAFLVFFMLVSALGGIHWCECGTCGSLSPIAALKQVNEDIIYMECYREVSRGAGFCALHW